MDARCPECEKVAVLDDEITNKLQRLISSLVIFSNAWPTSR